MQNHMLHFVVMFFQFETLSWSFLDFHYLAPMKHTKAVNFVECLSIWMCLMFPHDCNLVMYPWCNTQRWFVFFSVNLIWLHIFFTDPVTDDINFDHLMKAVS